tara:strand:+ start:286 stop:729 length:444 start_codon:yes stop_codon:yes gene_type:complete
MAEPGVTIVAKGPLFSSDRGRKLIEATNTGLLDLVELEGANQVKGKHDHGLYKPGGFPNKRHGRDHGDLYRAVGASLVKDLVARFDAGETQFGRNLIYASWVEGVSSRNAKTKFKGYKMFETAKKRIKVKGSLKRKYIESAIIRAFK